MDLLVIIRGITNYPQLIKKSKLDKKFKENIINDMLNLAIRKNNICNSKRGSRVSPDSLLSLFGI